MMVTFLTVLVALCMLGTLGVMLAGFAGLGRSDGVGGARSNRLMRMRVIMQGVTLALFIVLLLVRG